jgi:hypothetical protein
MRKYPLEQVRHRVEELRQVRQLLVQETQVLDVALRNVSEGQLEMHCFSYRIPVWQELQR